MSDWKPGDVAMVTDGNVEWVGMVRPRHEAGAALLEIVYAKGGFDIVDDLAEGYTIRPLVVIDPDDAEQVERLRVALDGRSFSAWACGANTVIAAALREFASPTPPKPEEPTGLGAVVEDDKGKRYVRYAMHDLAAWRAEYPAEESRPYRYFHDLNIVRVLSEGVTP